MAIRDTWQFREFSEAWHGFDWGPKKVNNDEMSKATIEPDDPNEFDHGKPDPMNRVFLKMWAEQDGTHNRIMVKVGDDPPMEYAKWERECMKRGWSASDANPAEPVIDSTAKDISNA